MHKNAEPAARAAMAAYQQGKFWQFHDKLFANQQNLSTESYIKYAKELGLNIDKFTKDMSVLSKATSQMIDADKSEADSLGVSGTPAFFVNGRFLSGAQPFEAFAKLIDEEMNRPRIK
jgi:protein-disulfide isomerase